MKNNIQTFALLSLFVFAIGCSSGPEKSDTPADLTLPQDGVVQLKGAIITPPILVDDCAQVVDSPCVIITENDSSSYNFCFKLYNSSGSLVTLNNAEVRIPLPNSANDYILNTCNTAFQSTSIAADSSKIFANSYCMDSDHTFSYGDTILFDVVTAGLPLESFTMTICRARNSN